jgi:hypothetical protein
MYQLFIWHEFLFARFYCECCALMTSSMLFLLVSLDRPFQGELNIQPDAFRALLRVIESGDPVKIPKTGNRERHQSALSLPHVARSH